MFTLEESRPSFQASLAVVRARGIGVEETLAAIRFLLQHNPLECTLDTATGYRIARAGGGARSTIAVYFAIKETVVILAAALVVS